MNNRRPRSLTLMLIFCLLAVSPVSARQRVADPQAALAAAASDPGDSPNWYLLHADAPLNFANMTPHSLGIASNGVVHVVFGGDHLYHAWKARGSWAFETVDPAWGVGSFASLAVDSFDNLHISYIDTAVHRLKYATNRNGSWQVETPSIGTGLNANNAAIAVDYWGDPHIVFSSGDSTLRYGFFDSDLGTWYGPETLATSTGLLDYPGAFALAVPNNSPVIPYAQVSYHKHISDTNGSLYYTKRTNVNTWSTSLDLNMGGDSDGDYNDIALNGDVPHIVASSNSTSPATYFLRYRYWNGASWFGPEFVSAGNATVEAISLHLVGGVPYLAYRDPGAGYYWMNRTGVNSWTTEDAIASGSTVGSWASFAWYNSYPYATYYDTSTRIFSFKFKTSVGWQSPYTLATNGHNVGATPSLAVDSLGRSHIAYGDSTAQSLLFTRYDGASFSNLTVDAGPVYGISDLALENNLPKVLYLGTDGTVRFSAMLCAPVCGFLSPETVDSGLSAINQPALAIHASTGVQAAYNKNGNLIFVKRIALNNWSQEPVDTGMSGMVSMALDGSGQPHLLYKKGSNLVHSYKDTSWHVGEIVATTSTWIGAQFSLQISPQGVMAAAYINVNGSNWNVTFATRACTPTCTWTPTTIASDADEFVDLVFDSKGVPHIAYFGYPAGDLKYAERTGSSTWVVKVVDSRGFVGTDPSIAISPLNGKARIAYPDGTNADLKLALEGELLFVPTVKK